MMSKLLHHLLSPGLCPLLGPLPGALIPLIPVPLLFLASQNLSVLGINLIKLRSQAGMAGYDLQLAGLMYIQSRINPPSLLVGTVDGHILPEKLISDALMLLCIFFLPTLPVNPKVRRDIHFGPGRPLSGSFGPGCPTRRPNHIPLTLVVGRLVIHIIGCLGFLLVFLFTFLPQHCLGWIGIWLELYNFTNIVPLAPALGLPR
ncbi:hypothetical protein CASFOL_021800 [Castilleja foliolosa]|uniref:Uncharacterized protein n=1 Tax=Castilleja foliolosa TaxID=1961234 RepID=A0ABD3CXM1_9LAMI